LSKASGISVLLRVAAAAESLPGGQPRSKRLAVTTSGDPWVYDTLDQQIGGFGQQQGGGPSITFTSQYGTVNLAALPVAWREGSAVLQAPAQMLAQLGQLMEKGYISKEAFAAKKSELLGRI
jgi:hypothetical protein